MPARFNETKLVIDTALKSEENLDLALIIADAYEGIRLRVAREFVDELEKRLRLALGLGWEFDNSFVQDDPHKGLWFRKPSWPGQTWVGLKSYRWQSIDLGIIRDMDNPKKEPFLAGAEVKALLDARVKRGGANEFWVWSLSGAEPYPNLQNHDTLRAFYRKGDALEHFRSLLLRVVEVASPVLNRAGRTTR